MSNASGAEQRLPSSLYCDLFYTNPGADEFRLEHLKVWLRIFLSHDGTSSEDELVKAFASAHPGANVDLDTVHNVCEMLVDAGQLARHDGGLVVTARGSSQVADARQRFGASRDHFLESVVTYVSSVGGARVTQAEEAMIRDCVQDLIARSMLSERKALEALFKHPNDFTSVFVEAKARSAELDACFARTAPVDTLATRLIELRRDALNGVSRSLQISKDYLHTLHRSVVGALFLIQDPYHTENIRTTVRNRIYFIDTNVYFAWRYLSQSAHATVQLLMDLMHRYGVTVCMLPESLAEISHVEGEARKAIARGLRDGDVAKFLIRGKKVISADFFRMQAEDKNLTLQFFEKAVMGASKHLDEIGVEIVDVEYEPGEDFLEMIPTFRNAIRGVREDAGRIVRTEALDHDAAALVAMAKLQLTGDRDSFGSKIRFLSLDGSLNPAIQEVRNVVQKRLEPVDNPFALARVLLPGSEQELSRNDYEDYVVNAIEHELGVATEMRGYSDLYLIERLEETGIPIRTMLDLPGRQLETALSTLQGRKGLSRKLDQATQAPNEKERSKVRDEILNDLHEALAFGSDLMEETETRLLETRRASTELQQTVENLSKQVDVLSARALREQDQRLADQVQASDLRRQDRRTIGILLATIVVLIAVLVFVAIV